MVPWWQVEHLWSIRHFSASCSRNTSARSIALPTAIGLPLASVAGFLASPHGTGPVQTAMQNPAATTHEMWRLRRITAPETVQSSQRHSRGIVAQNSLIDNI